MCVSAGTDFYSDIFQLIHLLAGTIIRHSAAARYLWWGLAPNMRQTYATANLETMVDNNSVALLYQASTLISIICTRVYKRENV